MRDDEMIWLILTYAGIYIYRQEYVRSVQIHQKYITDNHMECMCQNKHLAVINISQVIKQNTNESYHNIL